MRNAAVFVLSLIAILDIGFVRALSWEGYESGSSSSTISSSTSSSFSSSSLSSHVKEVEKSSTKCYRQQCHEPDGGPVVCRCDRKCFFFGDCCFGVRTPPSTILEKLRFDTTVWECVHDSFLPLFYPELNHGYRMVTRCPHQWPVDDVRRKCEAASGNHTVLYVVGEDYYRSVPCAICNGIDESSLSPIYGSDQCIWQSKNELECLIEPNSSSPILDQGSDNNTVIVLNQEIPVPRFCLFGIQDNCPSDISDMSQEENAWFRTSCQRFYVPMMFNQSVLKNPFCAVCNSNDTDSLCNIWVKMPVVREHGEGFFSEGIGAVFSGIVNRGQTKETEAGQPNGQSLSSASIWPMCTSEETSLIYKNGNVKCFKNDTCSINANITAAGGSISSSFDFVENIGDALASGLDLADIPSLLALLQLFRNGSDERGLPDNLTVSEWCHHVKYNQDPLSESNCSNEWYVGQPDEFQPFVILNESFIFFNGSFIKPIWWRNMTDICSVYTDWTIFHQMHLCGVAQEIRFCPSITVTEDSVEWIVHMNETVLKFGNTIYFQEEFFVHPDGRILLCVDEKSQGWMYRALDIAGNVAFAVSSACLLLTLLSYLIFSELQNRQGIVVINFLVALLFGQILLQYIGHHFSQQIIPCLTAASLSHFFFLASFVWTTVVAWDLRRSLSTSRVTSKFGRSRCKIAQYALVGWGIPLLIAFITLLLHLGGFSNQPILEYGGPACWFATRVSSLAVFFGPVCVCLLANCCLFFITMRNLHSTNKSTIMVRKSSNVTRDQLVSELKIFVKISALLGFAWLFGFLAMVINILITWYLFIIISGLQGVFIFLSFGANERVRKLWRSFLGRTFQRNPQSHTDSTTQ